MGLIGGFSSVLVGDDQLESKCNQEDVLEDAP